MAAPRPPPVSKPATALPAMMAPLPTPHRLKELGEVEHLVAAALIPAPVPAPTAPKMKALRRR